MFQRCFNHNKLWKDLLNEYVKRNVLDESTLWKNYLEDHYNLAIFHIQENTGLDLWILIDKNTGVITRCTVNLTIRKFCEIDRMQSYLLVNKQLSEIKHTTCMYMYVQIRQYSSKCITVKRIRKKYVLLVTGTITYIRVGKNILFFKNTYVLIYILHTICIYLTSFTFIYC